LSLLLIDIGNTRVKWARLVDGKMGPQQAAANSGWTAADYARRVIGRGWTSGAASTRRSAGIESGSTGVPRLADVEADIGTRADRVVVSSVAGDEVNRALTEAAAKAGAPTPEFVASERSAAGVTTDYIDPWRLGVDRFVAAIGAHHLSSGQPVCVVNIGTAMTVDLIDGAGRHHGGAIVPGPALMVSSLLTQTNGIRRRAKGGPDGATGMFAKTTRNAIGEGARYAAAGVIDRALEEARILVGIRPLVLLTGGASADIKPLIRSTCVSLPDLVLHGLAVWAHQTPATVRPESAGTRHPETARTQGRQTSPKRSAETARKQGSQTSRKHRPVV
jgi:type III pantothenate kinase